MHSGHNFQIQFVNVRFYGYNRLQVVFTSLEKIKCNASFSSLQCYLTVNFVIQLYLLILSKVAGLNAVHLLWRSRNQMVETIKSASFTSCFFASYLSLIPFSFFWNLKKEIKFEILWNKRVFVLLTEFKVKKSHGELTECYCFFMW